MITTLLFLLIIGHPFITAAAVLFIGILLNIPLIYEELHK